MPDERQRRARRLLWAWALVSLLTLAYVGLVIASSVPVSAATETAFSEGADTRFTSRDRLVASTVDAHGEIATVADASERTFGAPGNVILYRLDDADAPLLPFRQDPDVRVARALAYVARDPDTGNWTSPGLNRMNATTLTVPGVPVPGNTTADAATAQARGFTTANVTVNLSALDGDHGFIVKADADASPSTTLVPMDAVTGKVMRATPAVMLYAAVGFSAIGAFFPVLLIVLAHRGHGPGLPRGAGPACGECRFPLDASLGFCSHCGAYQERRIQAPSRD